MSVLPDIQENVMGMSYKKLWKLLIDKNMNKGDLQRISGISTASIAKLAKGENVQTDVLSRICYALKCDTSDIMEFDLENTDPEKLTERKNNKIRLNNLTTGDSEEKKNGIN
jgi:DNA-binding Xre family transcriptional regulator